MLRYAFSPEADIHVGDLRTALINYIVAKQRGEGFILRIEDAELRDDESGGGGEIKQILEKFAIHADRVVHQSEQRRLYGQLAVRLAGENKAFLCLCTEKDLEAERQRAEAEKRPWRYSGRCLTMNTEEIRRIQEEKIPFVIRIRKPSEPVSFSDLLRGEFTADPGEVDHFVILRADGVPSRNFARACDDMTGGITTVIRPEEHLPDTPAEIHIRRSLGYEDAVEYAHLPPLLDADGKKISGRSASCSVRRLLEEGFLPDAIINCLLLLGNETPVRIFTLPEAVEWFDLKKLSRSPVRFDPDCLRDLNREHLRRMDDLALSRIFGFADADIGRLAKLFLEEAGTVRELDEKIRAVFAPKNCSEKREKEMRTLSALILDAPMFGNFGDFEKHLERKSGFAGEELLRLLRLLMTGAEDGPEPGEMFPLINPYLTEVVRCQP